MRKREEGRDGEREEVGGGDYEVQDGHLISLCR